MSTKIARKIAVNSIVDRIIKPNATKSYDTETITVYHIHDLGVIRHWKNNHSLTLVRASKLSSGIFSQYDALIRKLNKKEHDLMFPF